MRIILTNLKKVLTMIGKGRQIQEQISKQGQGQGNWLYCTTIYRSISLGSPCDCCSNTFRGTSKRTNFNHFSKIFPTLDETFIGIYSYLRFSLFFHHLPFSMISPAVFKIRPCTVEGSFPIRGPTSCSFEFSSSLREVPPA